MVRSPSPADKPPCAAFDSHPSDLGLVKSYLRPWIDSGLKAGTFIHEADVYAADPADLTREFPPAVSQGGERAWYFFTPLHCKSGRGKRKARTVANGDGWWHNEAKSKPVVDTLGGGRQVGYRQSFSFMKKEGGGARVRTGWLMMELRLERDPGHGHEAQEEGSMGNLVLCKVYRSPRNPEPADGKPTAPGLKTDAGDDDSSPAPAPAPEPKGKVEAGDDESSAAMAAAPQRPKGKAADDESSDASLAAAASRSKRKSDGEESSAATVAAPRRHRKADDEISGAATAAAASGREEKAARDEDSAETSAAAPGCKRKAADHDESSGAASTAAPARKRKAADGSSSGAPKTELQLQLHCPQCGCGFHVDVAESVVAAAKSKLETKSGTGAAQVDAPQGGVMGDSSVKKKHSFLEFL